MNKEIRKMTNASDKSGNFYNKPNDISLKESEIRYRNLIETINDFAWEVDGNGVYWVMHQRNC